MDREEAPIAKFRKAEPDKRLEIVMCDESAAATAAYSRKARALGARLRMAERERAWRLKGQSVSGPELIILGNPGE